MSSPGSLPFQPEAPRQPSPEEALATLRRGAAQIINESELLEKLRLPRPLRVKLGVDPTAPDIHLGHTVVFQKLREFQDLGHTAVLIIGDFTAMIGDPSGRSVTRPPLSHDAVMANAETYRRQALKVLDPDRTEIVFNGEWFEVMTYEEVIRLNSRVTLQQIMQREDFKARFQGGTPVSLHELQYPLLQGWDSVMVRADVEIGGTDQLFNILVARDLQKEEGLPPQVVLVMPILEGLDGVQKMSKSLGNYIGVAESPTEMFGKTMSISDELMARYYQLLLGEPFPAELHPMEAKKSLAARIVARYHSDEDARAARADFEQRFSKRDNENADLPVVVLLGVAVPPSAMFIILMSIPDASLERNYQSLLGEQYPMEMHPSEAKRSLATRVVARYHSDEKALAARADFEQRFGGPDAENAELPKVILPESHDDFLSVVGHIYFGVFKIAKSRSDLRRLIEGGSVKWRDKKITDPKAPPNFAEGGVLRLDKTRAVRIEERDSSIGRVGA